MLQFKKYNNYFGLYQIGIVTTDGKEVVEAVYDDIAYTADNDDSTILLTKYIEGGDKNDTENIIGSYGSHTFNDRELSVYLLKENCTIDLDFAEYKFLLSSPKLYYFNVFSYTDKGGNRKFYMPLRYEEDDYCLIFDSLGNFVSAISNSDTPYKTKAWRTNNQKYLVLSSTEVLDLEKDELVEAFLSNDKLLRYDLVKGNSLTGDLIPYTYGFMNIKGEHVIEYSDYHIFLALDDGYYLTWSNSGSYEGIVSADGKEIVKPIYDDVDGPIDGYFSVSFGGDVDNNKVKAYFGCVNSEGVLTSPVQWEGSSQQDFFDAHTFGSKNVIVNPADGTYTEYAKATHLHGKFYLISDGNKIGFATWSEPLTECIYDKADEESDFISYDEKVMVGRIGKTYTIYSLHV